MTALAALSAAALSAGLCGCGAALVESRRPRRGPVTEVGVVEPGGGEVRYSTEGWRAFVNSRREDALVKMASVCGGAPKVKVLEEVDREAAEAAYNSGDMEDNIGSGGRHYRKERYRHIVFECLP